MSAKANRITDLGNDFGFNFGRVLKPQMVTLPRTPLTNRIGHVSVNLSEIVCHFLTAFVPLGHHSVEEMLHVICNTTSTPRNVSLEVTLSSSLVFRDAFELV